MPLRNFTDILQAAREHHNITCALKGRPGQFHSPELIVTRDSWIWLKGMLSRRNFIFRSESSQEFRWIRSRGVTSRKQFHPPKVIVIRVLLPPIKGSVGRYEIVN